MRSSVSALIEEHIVEAVVYLRFDARVGNRKPKHDLHSRFVNAVYELLDIGNFGLRNLPVAAEFISAVVVVGLPAVVNDDGVHSDRLGELAFLDDVLDVEHLVIAVPKRVHRELCVLGDVCGTVSAFVFPPGHGVVDRIVIGNIARVDAHRRRVFLNGSNRDSKEIDQPIDASILLAHTGAKRGGGLGIRQSDRHSVSARHRNEGVNRHPGCKARLRGALMPKRAEMSFAAYARTPDRINIHIGNAERDAERLGNSFLLKLKMNVKKKHAVLAALVVNIDPRAVVAANNFKIHSSYLYFILPQRGKLSLSRSEIITLPEGQIIIRAKRDTSYCSISAVKNFSAGTIHLSQKSQVCAPGPSSYLNSNSVCAMARRKV